MSRHVVEKARDIGKEISHASRKVKRKFEKFIDNRIDKVVTANKKADERAKRKGDLGKSTPHGGGTTSSNPGIAKNGGII